MPKYVTKNRKYYASQGLTDATGNNPKGADPKQLVEWSKMSNIAPELKDDLVRQIGVKVTQEYKYDKDARKDWERTMNMAIKFVKMDVEEKNTPFAGACSVIMPLLAQSCIQFSSRATGALFSDKIVKGKVIGQDKDGQKASSAQRVADFTNYQLTEEMPEWMPETDSAMFGLPLFGCAFKKTYRYVEEKRNYSEYVSAMDLVIHPEVTDLKTAKRATHYLELTRNTVKERINSGAWSDILSKIGEGDQEAKQTSQGEDEGNYIFLEQHRWWDLDGDGYAEPYIVTVHKETDTVARIKARYKEDDIWLTPDGKEIAKIEVREMFTRILFMPAIDKSIYGFGFGQLLAHPNDAINAILREIIDSGIWYNTNAGLYTSDLMMASNEVGNLEFEPNEFKEASDVDDLRKKFMLLPAREPSMTLFHTLGLLMETYQRLGMSVDVLGGQASGANQPATTTLALIEQGLKLHTAVMGRVHRGIGEELKKIYRLNMEYLGRKEYYNVMDVDEEQQVFARDFNSESVDITLSALPEDVMHIQKMLKADKLMEMRQTVIPPVAQAIFEFWLDAMQIEDKEKFKIPDDYKPPPDPKVLEILAEKEAAGLDFKLKMEELKLKKLEVAQKHEIAKQEIAIKKMEAAARIKQANKPDKPADKQPTKKKGKADGKDKKSAGK